MKIELIDLEANFGIGSQFKVVFRSEFDVGANPARNEWRMWSPGAAQDDVLGLHGRRQGLGNTGLSV